MLNGKFDNNVASSSATRAVTKCDIGNISAVANRKHNPNIGDDAVLSSAVYNTDPENNYDEIPDCDFGYNEVADSHVDNHNAGAGVYNDIETNNSEQADDAADVYNDAIDSIYDVYEEIAGSNSASINDNIEHNNSEATHDRKMQPYNIRFLQLSSLSVQREVYFWNILNVTLMIMVIAYYDRKRITVQDLLWVGY